MHFNIADIISICSMSVTALKVITTSVVYAAIAVDCVSRRHVDWLWTLLFVWQMSTLSTGTTSNDTALLDEGSHPVLECSQSTYAIILVVICETFIAFSVCFCATDLFHDFWTLQICLCVYVHECV